MARRDFRLDGGAGRQARLFASGFVSISKKVTLLCVDSTDSDSISNEGFSLCSLENKGDLETFGKRVREVAAGNNSWIHSHEWIEGANSIRLGDGLHISFLRRMREATNGFQQIRFLNYLHRRKLRLERASLLSPQLEVVVSPSTMCADELRSEYPDFCGSVHVIHNPINERYLNTTLVARRKTSTLNLGFVGSGWRRKGLSFLLRAIAHTDRDIRLRVAGFDKHARQYRALANSLKIQNKIEWLGVQSDLRDFYSRIDVLVLPAIYEPSGNVVLEAMAMGCQVIVSENTGYQEFVCPEVGLVTPCDPLELARAISSFNVLDDKELLRARVKHLTPANLTDQLLKVFTKS